MMRMHDMSGFGAIRTPNKIIFGKGQRGALGTTAKSLGSRAFVCTDTRLSSEHDFAAMIDDLKNNGIAVHIYDRTVAELPLTCVEDCVATAKPFNPDIVVGIGGGSCLDLAKAAALMLVHSGNIRDYYGEFKVPGPVLPLVLIPTTSGTGSEVTPVAVLSDPDKNMKVGIASPYIISHTAICDPELTYSCPPSLTAATGADALTHAIEAFTAIRHPVSTRLIHEHVFIGKNMFSDQYALLAIERISRSLERAHTQGNDEVAREDLMFGALSAGLAFGTAGTAAAHAIQYPVGAFTHTPHGTGVALLLPYVMDFNRSERVFEFAQIAVAMGLPDAEKSPEQLSNEAVHKVAELFRAIGIPKTLAELGMPANKLDWVAEQSFTVQRLVNNNPKPLDISKITKIVKAAYDGRLMSAAA